VSTFVCPRSGLRLKPLRLRGSTQCLIRSHIMGKLLRLQAERCASDLVCIRLRAYICWPRKQDTVVRLNIDAIQAEMSIQRSFSDRACTIGRLSKSRQISVLKLPSAYSESRHLSALKQDIFFQLIIIDAIQAQTLASKTLFPDRVVHN
jgi:hypothetical protein